MSDRDEDEVNLTALRAARELREPVPVRVAWRDALLERVAADEPRVQYRARTGWTVRPVAAVAAAVVLLAIGVLAGRASLPAPVVPTIAALDTAAVRFVLVAPGAAQVSLVGDFNQWNPKSLPLRRLSDGTWIVDVPLAPGRYAYAFMVDGKITADPTAPRSTTADDFGLANSIVMVRGS